MTHPTFVRRQLAAAVLLSGSAAFAVADHEPSRPDLPISIETAAARAAEHFNRVDQDSDGLISPAEFAAIERSGRRAPPWRHHMRRGKRSAHTHGDHPRNPAQDTARDAALFDALDTNADGQVSKAEFAQRRDAMQTLRRARQFGHLDRNSDGMLDPEEFPARFARLKALDANADGEVTRDEFRAGAHRDSAVDS